MTPSLQHERRSTIRMDARLDQSTWQTVDDLAHYFHTSRAAVLCHIMHWGLGREQTEPIDQGNTQGPVHHLYLSVPSDLHEHVEKTAAAAGLKIAAWLRHTVRQVTLEDFLASWPEATPTGRSHDSRTYTARFMLRLDEAAQAQLEHLIKQVGASKAAIIRHLITQAKPEDFPKSWLMKAVECRAQQPRQ